MLDISLIQAVIAVLRGASTNLCPASSDYSIPTINCWGDMPEFARERDQYNPLTLYQFHHRNLKNAIIEKLDITGANDVLFQMKNNPTAFTEEAAESYARRLSLCSYVGKENVHNKPGHGDNHDCDEGGTLGEVHFVLNKFGGTSAPIKWVLNIITHFEFDFSGLTNDAIINLNSTFGLQELFQDDLVRLLFIQSYARWGQLAWHGWRFLSEDCNDELYIAVWPKVWDKEREDIVRWHDPNTPLELVVVPFEDSDESVLKVDPWKSLAGQYTCPTDVLNFGTDNSGGDVRHYRPLQNTTGAFYSKVLAGNAAHEFGHSILIAHSKNRRHVMYGGEGSSDTTCWAQKNNKLICEFVHPKVALRPHIFWAEKKCESITGRKIKWTSLSDK